MKKTLFVLLFSLSFLSSYGQQIPLDSFYVPGALWTQTWYHFEPCIDRYYCLVISGLEYSIEKDSVISGNNYHLLAIRKLGSYSHCPTFCTYRTGPESTGTVFARLRVEGKKVWITQDSQVSKPSYPNYLTLGTEYLLYNFDMYPGLYMSRDTFRYDPFIVGRIDTLLLSGSNYTKIYTDTSYGYHSIIEGIGSENGLLSEWGTSRVMGGGGGFSSPQLLCYKNPSFEHHFDYYASYLEGDLGKNCFDIASLGVSPALETGHEKLTIYPNPVFDEINLGCEDPDEIFNLQITDITGKLIYAANGPLRNKLHKIPFHQKPGMYFMKIFFRDNTFIYRKISVQ